MKTSDFDQLMRRYVMCNVSGQEKKKVEVWLALKKVECDIGLNLSEDDEERVLQNIRSTLDSIDSVIVFRRGKSCLSKFVSRTWTQVVTSVVFIALLSLLVWGACVI